MPGALYKIQSWHPPAIGSVDIDVLLVGMVTTAIGIALITVSSFPGAKQPAERLHLDETRVPKSEVKEPLTDDDLLV